MKRHDNSDIKRENRRAIRIFIPILLASAVSAAVQGFSPFGSTTIRR